MKDDTALSFKDGKITQEGRNQKVEEWEIPAATGEIGLVTPETLLSQAGPSSETSQLAEPRNGETIIAGPLTNELETKAISSVIDKKGIVEPEPKRTKSSKKKKSKGVPPHTSTTGDAVPLIPETPGIAEPDTAQLDAGVDGRRESKDIDEGRASERDQRSGRQSTEVDGSERRKPVHLFRDAHMIPAAFPGARILSFTYPKISAEIANEYLDKVAQKLLESLVKAREKLPSNTTPIVLIGYGFGGLVLQKLLVLAAAADEKNAEASQVLSMTAGLVFLDTPFPATKQDEKTETPSFPSPNGRQERIMRKLKEFGNKLDIETLWESFHAKRQIQDQKLPMVWLYTVIPKDSSSASKVYTSVGAIRRSRS